MRISSKGLLTLPQTLGGQGPWPRRSGQGRTQTVQGYQGSSPCRDVLAQDLLPDPERFLVERFGFGVLAHSLVQRGQVIEAQRRVGMFWPKNLLPDPERFLKERFGFGILAHRLVQHGQVIEAVRRVGMFMSPRTFWRIRSAS